MPKARTTVKPLVLRPDASPEEQAHARGLNEGMLRKVHRIKQEIAKRQTLAQKLVKKIGLRNKRIAELEFVLQDLYDWGPGENAPPAATAAWDRAHALLHPDRTQYKDA